MLYPLSAGITGLMRSVLSDYSQHAPGGYTKLPAGDLLGENIDCSNTR